MRNTFLAGVATLGLALGSCGGTDTPSLEYEIVKSRVDSLPALEVRVHFSPDDGEVTHLLYQDEAWGETGLFKAIREVKLLEGSGSLRVEPDSGRIRIRHAPNPGRLTLSYKVVQDPPGPDARTEPYRPIVQPTYFHVFAHNLLMIPTHYQVGEAPTSRIRLKWTGWGAREVIHNSFGSGQLEQDLGDIPLDKFQIAIFVGGDFRVYSEQIEGNGLYLATRGDWVPFQDEKVMELLTSTVGAQRDFWHDHSQRYFTVTMRPFPMERGSSFQGTGLTNSFATSLSNNAETELDQLLYLFNHELMHNWIGSTIENEAEEAQYWFSEGFTDYYTAKNIAANTIGGKDWSFYIGHINETLRLLEASPVKEAPNSEITYENFWNNPEYGKLPYRRGLLFAFCLDLQIREGSKGQKSLDDAMRDLLRNARTPGWKLNSETFVQAVNAYLPNDLTPFFQKHIIDGQALPLSDLFDRIGFAYTEEADVFDLGFSWDTDRKEVTAVDPGSQAYAAGVRAGDRLVSWSINHGQMEREVELVLDREEGQLPVRFFPVRKAQVVQLLDTPANRDLLSAKP